MKNQELSKYYGKKCKKDPSSLNLRSIISIFSLCSNPFPHLESADDAGLRYNYGNRKMSDYTGCFGSGAKVRGLDNTSDRHSEGVFLAPLMAATASDTVKSFMQIAATF